MLVTSSTGRLILRVPADTEAIVVGVYEGQLAELQRGFQPSVECPLLISLSAGFRPI